MRIFLESHGSHAQLMFSCFSHFAVVSKYKKQEKYLSHYTPYHVIATTVCTIFLGKLKNHAKSKKTKIRCLLLRKF